MRSKVTNIKKELDIDWGKVNIVESVHHVILTSGDNKGVNFSGTVISNNTGSEHEVGKYLENWFKGNFKLRPGKTIVEFDSE